MTSGIDVGQGDLRVPCRRQQVDDTCFEAAQRIAEQAPEVGLAPAVVATMRSSRSWRRLKGPFTAHRRESGIKRGHEPRSKHVPNTDHARQFADSIGCFGAEQSLEDDTPEGAPARTPASTWTDTGGANSTYQYDGSHATGADGTAAGRREHLRPDRLPMRPRASGLASSSRCWAGTRLLVSLAAPGRLHLGVRRQSCLSSQQLVEDTLHPNRPGVDAHQHRLARQQFLDPQHLLHRLHHRRVLVLERVAAQP